MNDIKAQIPEYMRESDNYLFHFTRKYDSLISIMTEKFKPFYSVENFSFLYEREKNLTMAFPMVCFCDIPIERHLKHKNRYGEYGIGLTKEWGQRNHLNIVNYTYRESGISTSLRIIVDLCRKYFSKESVLEESDKWAFTNAFNILLMTSKPYEGSNFCQEEKKWSGDVCRFYDEKEWRYLCLNVPKWSITLENNDFGKFFEDIHSEQTNIQKTHKLDFSVNDIKYIFLNCEEEKDRFISDISDFYSESEREQIKKLIWNSKMVIN